MNQEIKHVKFENSKSNTDIFEIAYFIIDNSRKLEISYFPNTNDYNIVFIKDKHRCHLSELSDQFGWDWFGYDIKKICNAEDHWIKLGPLNAQQVNDVIDNCLKHMKEENIHIALDLTDEEIESVINICYNKKKAYQKLLGV